MRFTPRLLVNLIAVVLLGVVLVAWVVRDLAGGGAFEDDIVVTADFAASGGVFTDQEVTYRGVTIGRVGDLRLNEDGVDIPLLLEPEWDDKVPAEVVARIQSKSAVGEQFVNLTPVADPSGGTLSDGDRIPRERTRLPVDFQKLLSTVNDVLADVSPGHTRRVIKAAAGGLAGRGDEIGIILESLADLSDAFADVAPQQQSLLDNATRTGSAFLRTKDEFARAVEAADRVFAGLGDEPQEIRALLVNNDRLAREGLRLLDKHGGKLRSGIRGLNELVDLQLRHRDELVVKSLRFVPDFFRAIEETAVPWVSPEGERFYRIRTGLVVDNVPASWPCKYDNKLEWERFHFERRERETYTEMRCRTETIDDADLGDDGDVLRALEAMARDLPPTAGPKREVPAAGEAADDTPEDPPSLAWPLRGPVTSRFDGDGDRRGIEIVGSGGSGVTASADGVVAFTGATAWYGNVVIVEHVGGMATLYAHLSDVAVDTGAEIERGAAIGSVGCTGVCVAPNLHFEVRVHDEPVDPLVHLPGGPLFSRIPPSSDGFIEVPNR